MPWLPTLVAVLPFMVLRSQSAPDEEDASTTPARGVTPEPIPLAGSTGSQGGGPFLRAGSGAGACKVREELESYRLPATRACSAH